LCTLSVFLARHHLFLYTHFPVPFFIIAHAKQTTIQPSLCPLSRVSNFVWARISRQTRWLKMSDEWGTTRVLWIRELGILSECLWALVRISRTYARSSSDKRNFGRVGRSFCAEQAPNALSKKVTFHKESSHCVAISHVWMCGRVHVYVILKMIPNPPACCELCQGMQKLGARFRGGPVLRESIAIIFKK
jgi:hypothetical protein